MSSAIRLITDQSTLYYSDPKNSYLISKDNNFLFFKPKGKYLLVGFLQHVKSQEKIIPDLVHKAIKEDVGIVYVCDSLPDNPIIHQNIVYVKVQWAWLIHTLFFNPLLFKGVFGNSKTKRLVDAFSKFTQYNIPVIENLSNIDYSNRQYIRGTDNLLFEIQGGIGDHLLCTPTLKTFTEQGKNIHLLIDKHRNVCFDNLPYIHKFYYSKKDINVSDFDGINWLNFGQVLNDYHRELNQQNRIFAVANLCSLAEEDLVRNIPEIILTDKEKEFGFDLIKDSKYNLFFGFDSARGDSKIPIILVQDVINQLHSQGFSIYTTAVKEQNLDNCYNLTGKLNVRQLFSLINVMDYVLTIDTSFLHIAAAFEKRIFVLMNYFNPDWRVSTYKNCKAYEPNIKCKRCAGGWYVPTKERLCHYGKSCFYNFDWKEIINDIVKIKDNV